MCHPSPVRRAWVRTVVQSLDEVWEWGAEVVGFGSPIPDFLTGSEVRVRSSGGMARGVANREGRKVSVMASSIGVNDLPTSPTTRCRCIHSDWRDF